MTRIMKFILVMLLILVKTLSFAQNYDEEKLKHISDSLIKSNIGDCLFDHYIQFSNISVDTVVNEYKASDVSDPLFQNSTIYYFEVNYNLIVHDSLEEITLIWTKEYKLHSKYGIEIVEEQIRESSNCEIISVSDYLKILKKSKKRKAQLSGYFIGRKGVIGSYVYFPNKGGVGIGRVEVELHNGKKIYDRISCINF